MRNKYLFAVILIAGLIITGLSINQLYSQIPENNSLKQVSVKYTCPMHPEIIKDKPGKCPICGMTLVEKKETALSNISPSKDSTMMKQDNTKMMNDSSYMKHPPMKN